MKLINNNISPLPFYDNIALQNHRKDYAFGQIYQLITYSNMLLPFQVVLETGAAINWVRLYDFNSSEYVDITTSMIGNGLIIKSFEDFKLLKYPGILPIPEIIHEGLYYLAVNIDDTETIYSDVFTVTDNVSDYLLIEYSNSYNFELKNGIVDFSDNFSFKCYLNTQVGKPDYDFEEEATERMGYAFIESQVSKKIYKFTFIAPEYICDALRIVRLCETKQITSKLQVYDLTTFSIDPEWEDQGDLASVKCEFETDTAIANVGGTSGLITNGGSTNISVADEAVHAAKAYDLDDDSPIRDEFLSKIADDIAAGKITFLKGLESIGLAIFNSGAQFGNFIKASTGANVDTSGNAEFESVRVRSYFEAMEFIVNRLSAIEGDQLLTEADTIENIDNLGDNCYGLHLRSKWVGYFTAQVTNNVLKGIINTLSTGGNNYHTAWFRVNSVNAADNYIEVTQYPDEDTPAGQNYPPCEMMKIARWGNQTDTTRQSCLYLSSTEGRIVKLTGVTKPIIDKTNYGAVLGTPPEFLAELDLPIRDGRDYMYVPGLITTDVIRIDYQGAPIPEYVDRGPYSETEQYYNNALNPLTGAFEISDTWSNGCKYRCQKTGTTTAPAWNNTDWAMIEGNPDFTVDFAEGENIYDPDNFNATLTIVAKLYNVDITNDIADIDVVWARYSEDADGVERVSSDNAWAILHAENGKSLILTIADCDINGYMPKKIRFTATITLRDGIGNATATQTISYEY